MNWFQRVWFKIRKPQYFYIEIIACSEWTYWYAGDAPTGKNKKVAESAGVTWTPRVYLVENTEDELKYLTKNGEIGGPGGNKGWIDKKDAKVIGY